jgi:PAS domain S-box-containing protein
VTPSAPAAGRPPRLVLRFAIYSAIALALAWLAIFWVVRAEAEQRAQERTAAHAAEEAARIAPSLRASDFRGPVPAARRAELDAIVASELATGLIRMKLWSPDGVVTYSDDQSLIGDRAEDPAEIERVLAGQTIQEVTTLNEEGGSGEDLKAVESYAPVLIGDPPAPVGVLEVYEPYAPIAQEVRETVTPIAAALALTLVLLYAALFPILRQVTKALDSRHRRLEEHAAALGQALDERRKAEHRLSQAERNYRDLVEQLPLVTYVDRLDETSSSIYISPQIEDLLGYPPLVWLSDPGFFVKVLHPEDRERTLAAHRRAYETGESFSIKYRMRAKDGRIVWIHDEVTIAKDENGRPTHAQGFLVDVSEQRVSAPTPSWPRSTRPRCSSSRSSTRGSSSSGSPSARASSSAPTTPTSTSGRATSSGWRWAPASSPATSATRCGGARASPAASGRPPLRSPSTTTRPGRGGTSTTRGSRSTGSWGSPSALGRTSWASSAWPTWSRASPSPRTR